MSIKNKLQCIIKKSLPVDMDVNKIVIEIPKDKKNGDYSTNVAFLLTKELKSSPINIANDIIKNISDDMIDRIEVANPGFINFYINKDYLLNNINVINDMGKNYGKSDFGKLEKINIEYVSANPTGTLHIGHGRGAVYGDCLSKIMSFAGYDVTREYYINDAGNQIKNLGNSLYIRLMQEMGEKIDFPYDDEIAIKNYYSGDYLISVAEKFLSENYDTSNKIKSEGLTKENLAILSNYAKKAMFDLQHETLKTFRTHFDEYFSECSLYKSNEVENCVAYLKDKNLIYEQDGALWFKTTQFGDEQDRVIKKQDGSNTYLTSDIAYHINKLKRGYDILINVWGADHHGYIPRIKAAVEAFGYNPDALEVILGQLVNLIINGEQARMGKRSKMITLSDLIDEVGVDATRFWMLMRSCDTTLDFDVNLAKSANDDNPVFYAQYAHARACSILRHAQGEGVDNLKNIKQQFSNEDLNNIFSNVANFNIDVLFDEESGFEAIKKLILKLEEIKSVIYNCAKNRSVYQVCKYLLELGQIFHQFYNTNRVLTDDLEQTKARLILVNAFIIIMRLCLDLIGVAAVQKM